MALFVVSDLHIWGPDDPLYLSLLSLIQVQASSGDTVVLAGDLFDLMIGSKSVFYDRYRNFFQSLDEANHRGIKIHYIEGNHDFLLKQAFRKFPNVKIHAKDFPCELQGKRFYIAHGDLVDRKDYGYLLLRALFRSFLMKLFVFLVPGTWVDRLGRFLSRNSRKSKPSLPTELPLARREKLRKIYRSFAAERLSHGFDFVVLGHCHDLDEMSFLIGGRKGQYVNVGFPRVHGSYLHWTPGEEKIHRVRLPGNG